MSREIRPEDRVSVNHCTPSRKLGEPSTSCFSYYRQKYWWVNHLKRKQCSVSAGATVSRGSLPPVNSDKIMAHGPATSGSRGVDTVVRTV
jgi:hypothetical protein